MSSEKGNLHAPTSPRSPQESWTVSGTVNNQKRLQLNVNFWIWKELG